MTGLTSVKLPLKLAQSSGIDSGAFNGCDKLNTIEFDFTTTNLTNTLDNLDANAVTQLTNIYKMFAASDDSFRDNVAIDTQNNKPTKDKAWLPTTTNLTGSNFDDAKKAYHVNFNGITWSSKVTAPPEDVEFTTPNNNSGNATFTQPKQ